MAVNGLGSTIPTGRSRLEVPLFREQLDGTRDDLGATVLHQPRVGNLGFHVIDQIGVTHVALFRCTDLVPEDEYPGFIA